MKSKTNKLVAPLLLCGLLVFAAGRTMLKNTDQPLGWRFMAAAAGLVVFLGFFCCP